MGNGGDLDMGGSSTTGDISGSGKKTGAGGVLGAVGAGSGGIIGNGGIIITGGALGNTIVKLTPPQAWSEVAVANSPSCRYLRYVGPTGSATNVAEVEFWGLRSDSAGGGPGPQDAGAPMVNLHWANPPALATRPPMRQAATMAC